MQPFPAGQQTIERFGFTTSAFVMNMRFTIRIVLISGIVLSTTSAQERVPQLEYRSLTDPHLEVPDPVVILPDSWRALWAEALSSTEEDLRRSAAESILWAHRQGNASVQSLADEILMGFQTANNQTIQLTLATTLVGLDARSAAPDLFEFSQGGSMRVKRRVEPVLARWRYEPAFAVWLERLQRPADYSTAEVLLAIDGVHVTMLDTAIPALKKIVTEFSSSDLVRIAAADALGDLVEDGLEDISRLLLTDESSRASVNHDVAVRILRSHSGAAIEQLLQSAAVNVDSTIAARAIRQLLKQNPVSLHPLATQLLTSPDAEVRRLSIASRLHQPDAADIEQLGTTLNDRHPVVRNFTRETLLSLSNDPKLRTLILNQVDQLLLKDDWRGLEQAARMAAALDHASAAERLVELLRHSRSEVCVTAGWALRELAVTETFAGALEFAQDVVDTLGRGEYGGRLPPNMEACLAHLFELFGSANYKPSIPLLIPFIPKLPARGAESRSSAIWALGLLFKDDPPGRLVQALGDRASDADLQNVEHEEVRSAAAISLGRMKVQDALGALDSAVAEPGTLRTLVAARWAIGQIKDMAPTLTEAPEIPPAKPFLRSF